MKRNAIQFTYLKIKRYQKSEIQNQCIKDVIFLLYSNNTVISQNYRKKIKILSKTKKTSLILDFSKKYALNSEKMKNNENFGSKI